jgi:hypothetical protein
LSPGRSKTTDRRNLREPVVDMLLVGLVLGVLANVDVLLDLDCGVSEVETRSSDALRTSTLEDATDDRLELARTCERGESGSEGREGEERKE